MTIVASYEVHCDGEIFGTIREQCHLIAGEFPQRTSLRQDWAVAQARALGWVLVGKDGQPNVNLIPHHPMFLCPSCHQQVQQRTVEVDGG